MSQSSEKITKTVRIEVPSEVEQRARDRAGTSGSVLVIGIDGAATALSERKW